MTEGIETARELATHASDIKHLQNDMDVMKDDVAAIRLSLDEIKQTLASAEGGWKVLIVVGSLASGAIGAITGYFSSKGF